MCIRDSSTASTWAVVPCASMKRRIVPAPVVAAAAVVRVAVAVRAAVAVATAVVAAVAAATAVVAAAVSAAGNPVRDRGLTPGPGRTSKPVEGRSLRVAAFSPWRSKHH